MDSYTHAKRISPVTTTSTNAPTRTTAHGRSIGSAIDEIIRVLVQNLGKNVVAAVLQKDIRTIQRWLSPRGVTVGMDDERILRDVFLIYSTIEDADDAHVARAWFLGMNPHLNDSSPIDALIEGKSRAVVAAARTFANGG